MERIKPCPFCSSSDIREWKTCIQCISCGARAISLALWRKRKSLTLPKITLDHRAPPMTSPKREPIIW